MNEAIGLTDLENTLYPAFIVKSGSVIEVNEAAQQRCITPGMKVADLLQVGAEEYAEFKNGQLAVTLSIDNIRADAFIVRHEQFDVFYLESNYLESELRALAVAAQVLRSPMSGAMSIANHMLPNRELANFPDLEKQLAQINKNLHQLNRAISNMADAATFGNPSPAKIKNHNICAFLLEITEKVSALTESNHIDIECSCPQVPEFAHIDAERLERALMNLISNAIRHTHKYGKITISLKKSGKKLYISVQDGSIGGNPLHPHLFARFLREPGIDRGDSGIGLGLSLVRKAAAMHGGTLLVQTFEDEGTKFTMSIQATPFNGTVTLRSPAVLPIDFNGGYDRTLTELSDVLSYESFT